LNILYNAGAESAAKIKNFPEQQKISLLESERDALSLSKFSRRAVRACR